MIRDAVLHLRNEQPLFVDLFELPSAADVVLICTNVRASSGKRPQWVDDSASVFYFPYAVVRFVEIHPGSEDAPGPSARETGAGLSAPGGAGRPEPEPDLEIDEDLIRRVREV